MSAAPGKLAICLLASEVAPLSKTGGLGDVAGALAKYLHADGHDARLFTPLYSSIERAALAPRPVPGLTSIPLPIGIHKYTFSVLEAIRTDHFNFEDRSKLRFRDLAPSFSRCENRIYAISHD